MCVAVACPYNIYWRLVGFDPKTSHLIPAFVQKPHDPSMNQLDRCAHGFEHLSRLNVSGLDDGLIVITPKINRSLFCEVIAVDGGSTDGSIEYLQEQGITVIQQTKRGRGAAFAEGVSHTTGDALVFFSPDGNEDPDDLPKFIY